MNITRMPGVAPIPGMAPAPSISRSRGWFRRSTRVLARSLYLSLALAPPAAPAALAAQERPDSMVERARRGPMELLIQHRDSLGLTDDQVARLRDIRDRVSEANSPLVREMLEIRRDVRERLPEDARERRRGRGLRDLDPELRRELRPQIERARKLLREIRMHNRRAMRAVRDVLTQEQRERVRTWMRERRGALRGGRGPAPRRPDTMRGPRPGRGFMRPGGPGFHRPPRPGAEPPSRDAG